jgi:hypothetical protein
MSIFEVFLSVTSIVEVGSSLCFVYNIIKTGGSDCPPRYPAATLRLIERTKKSSLSQASLN